MVFAKTPLPLTCKTQLGAAFVRVDRDDAGNQTGRSYWNHAAGGFEPGPRDDSKHIVKLARLGSDPNDPDYDVQHLWPPAGENGPFVVHNVSTIIYTIDGTTGKAVEATADAMSRVYMAASTGQYY